MDFLYLLVGVLLGLVVKLLMRKNMEVRWLIKKKKIDSEGKMILQYRRSPAEKWQEVPSEVEFIEEEIR